ncbi:hypothetical protein [Thermomonospora umbrina]|uniref:Uncharacterized protein n=1 Tax=Thermomonospora umbrina TaxID=111806 RepID=A0A3D9SWA1_9ACTN|nr:hypothetical protein [Thermomonospora umbrina]REE98293.1 hypothetical protein DFJ69_3778 [Thermomonospora umbrina]
MHVTSFTRRFSIAALAITGTLALPAPGASAAPAVAAAPGASAAPAARNAPYLGRWNYDQPDRDSGRNIALLRCPADTPDCTAPGPNGGPLEVPQIGDIVYSVGPDGGVVARTDVGCTWRFAERDGSLVLSPERQYCFNQVNGVGYTITHWTTTTRGHRQREVITALSHRPGGDYEFVLRNGTRTRAPKPGAGGAVRRFAGSWAYTPANRATQVNMAMVFRPGAERPEFVPQTGRIEFSRARDGKVIARTDDGCRWTLVVRGNTAALATPGQTCELPGATVRLSHWTIAGDGVRQASRVRGAREDAGGTADFVLTIGDLRRAGRA